MGSREGRGPQVVAGITGLALAAVLGVGVVGAIAPAGGHADTAAAQVDGAQGMTPDGVSWT